MLTATILTMSTVDELASIHDRNPLALPEDHWEHWMDPSIVGDQKLVDEAVRAARDESSVLLFHKVSPFKPEDDGIVLTEPLNSL
ncbi:hypothetical protein GCM10010922_28240 [Microbacterium sorbitolivorans]|nr:hypothetical protein GCM10010922_28240 [Microbacterium sorbitolivorans]